MSGYFARLAQQTGLIPAPVSTHEPATPPIQEIVEERDVSASPAPHDHAETPPPAAALPPTPITRNETVIAEEVEVREKYRLIDPLPVDEDGAQSRPDAVIPTRPAPHEQATPLPAPDDQAPAPQHILSEEDTAPKGERARPWFATFERIRQWVAAAPDEPGDEQATTPPFAVESAPSPAPRPAAEPAPRPASEAQDELHSETVTLSIGTISVIVEEPDVPASPRRDPPAPAPRPAEAQGRRIRRHYLRGT